MGRLKKYQTLEEKLEAKRLRAKKYYWSNKEKIDEKLKQKYHANKAKTYKGWKIKNLKGGKN